MEFTLTYCSDGSHTWVCLGDFNEILSLDEKFGGSGRQRGLMKNFQNTLEVCGLSKLGYKGPKYTWNNEKVGADFTKERLDCVVANRGWCDPKGGDFGWGYNML